MVLRLSRSDALGWVTIVAVVEDVDLEAEEKSLIGGYRYTFCRRGSGSTIFDLDV